MQYIYVSTKVLKYGIDHNWCDYKNATQPVSELMDPYQYLTVYIQIKPATGSDLTPFWITGQQIFSIIGAVNSLLNAVLSQNFADDYFTPYTNPLFTVDSIDYIHYKDARQEEYQIGFSCAGFYTSPNTYRPPVYDDIPTDTLLTDLPDLIMAKPRYATNLSKIDNTCLVTVNGFVHNTILPVDENGNLITRELIYIKDGGKTGNITGYVRVSIIDFDEIGVIKKFPVSELTVTSTEEGGVLYGIVNISGITVDITDSQLLLSLGGYLIPLTNDIFTKVDAGTVSLDLTKVNIEKKIVESSYYLDLSSLGLNTTVPNALQVDYTLLQTNAVLQAYLNLSQTFLIVIPKKNITTYGSYFRRYKDNRKFETNYVPTQLLQSSTGKLINYWNTETVKDKRCYTEVHLADFMQTVVVTTSTLYPLMEIAYPALLPKYYDLLDYFISIGFFDDP